MVKSIVMVALVALLASPAVAQQAAAPQGSAPSPASASPVTPGDVAGPTVNKPANQSASAQPDKEPLVCHKMPPPTGTRLGGRTVCLTQKQWDQQEKDSQDALRGVLQRAGGASGPGAGS